MTKSARYGLAKLTAAVLGAPAAGLLVALALPKLTPAPSDLRYLLAALTVVPFMAVAPYFALRARTGGRAWSVSAVVMAASLVVIWSARP